MEAIAIRDFASVQLGNIAAGDKITLTEKQYSILLLNGIVKAKDERQVVQVPEPRVTVVQVPEPEAMPDEPLTDERQDLIAKASALGIKIDARWSTKRLRQVVIG